jgi:hypothetical protein
VLCRFVRADFLQACSEAQQSVVRAEVLAGKLRVRRAELA